MVICNSYSENVDYPEFRWSIKSTGIILFEAASSQYPPSTSACSDNSRKVRQKACSRESSENSPGCCPDRRDSGLLDVRFESFLRKPSSYPVCPAPAMTASLINFLGISSALYLARVRHLRSLCCRPDSPSDLCRWTHRALSTLPRTLSRRRAFTCIVYDLCGMAHKRNIPPPSNYATE